MKKLYEVTTLDSQEQPLDQFEVMADDLTAAYQMASIIFRGGLPPIMWIGPSGQDWYVIFKNTEENVLTQNGTHVTVPHAQGGVSVQN